MDIILLIIIFVFFFSLVFLIIKYLFIPFLFAPMLNSEDVIEFLENQELVFVDERGLNKEESKLNNDLDTKINICILISMNRPL